MVERSDVPVQEVAALYANRIYLTVSNEGVRLTFGESPDGKQAGESLHTAVFVPSSILPSLVELLGNSKRLLAEARDVHLEQIKSANEQAA